MFLDELLEKNDTWSSSREAKPLPAAEPMALAVVTCFDPRLDPLLRPSLGLGPREGFFVRTGGALLQPDSPLLRALTVAVYLFEIPRVLVLGHSSCKMASFETSSFVDTFRRRGVAREAFGDGDLRTWAGAIATPRDGVLRSMDVLRSSPALPRDLEIAGALLDDRTGRIEGVCGQGTPKLAAPPKQTVEGTPPPKRALPPPVLDLPPPVPSPPPPVLDLPPPVPQTLPPIPDNPPPLHNAPPTHPRAPKGDAP
ncbi:MAG: carbonic anhydrase [Acidobacteriota bacterium]